jgi:hypothetical protein
VVGEFEEFFDADPCGPENFDRCPGPECAVFFLDEVAAFAGGLLSGPDPGGGPGGGRAGEGLPAGGE